MKSSVQSKTMWLNGLIIAASTLAFLQGHELIAANPKTVAGIGIAAGIINGILRLVTNEAINGGLIASVVSLFRK